MTEKIFVSTRWQYYVANVIGILFLLFMIGLCMYNSIHDGKLAYKSVLLWVAVISFFSLPFAIISFFSSMKTIVIVQKLMTITYVFQKHQNSIALTDVVGFQSKIVPCEKVVRPAPFTDSFSLSLRDGRSFSFTRSQFNDYDKLKAVVYKAYVINGKRG